MDENRGASHFKQSTQYNALALEHAHSVPGDCTKITDVPVIDVIAHILILSAISSIRPLFVRAIDDLSELATIT